ncbi:hypothetical protein JHK82_024307 [Glycine max]|nr:hypothetical protein JHK85_024887 [Glycine max]KAG5012139.1 hypothetical protein JHK86_024400 [Glycine max]KAG5133119.1 hypothetical protein JHK82_024307 [Glycine max]
MEIYWRFSHRIVWEDCVLICLCDMLLKPRISLRLVSQFDVVQYQVQWNPTVMKNVTHPYIFVQDHMVGEESMLHLKAEYTWGRWIPYLTRGMDHFLWLSKWMSHGRSQKRGVACIEDLSSIVSPNVNPTTVLGGAHGGSVVMRRLCQIQ